MRRKAARGATLNIPTITLEFGAVGKNMVTVKASHFEGYDSHEPRFEVRGYVQDTSVEETEREILMSPMVLEFTKDPAARYLDMQ